MDGKVSENIMESAAFILYLFGRMTGTAADIDDRTNRGRNMESRTQAPG